MLNLAIKKMNVLIGDQNRSGIDFGVRFPEIKYSYLPGFPQTLSIRTK